MSYEYTEQDVLNYMIHLASTKQSMFDVAEMKLSGIDKKIASMFGKAVDAFKTNMATLGASLPNSAKK